MVAILGAVLNTRLRQMLDSDANAAIALQPGAHEGVDPAMLLQIRDALQSGLHTIFLVCLGLGVVALAVALLFPAGAASAHAHNGGS
jgi:hypothetical protein